MQARIKELESALTYCIDTDKESQARIAELETQLLGGAKNVPKHLV
jgi:uncharacterized coiled-coil protein SlyX